MKRNNIFGLIGRNIDYSFSKNYFTKKFALENINYTYQNFDIDNIKILESIFSENKIAGLNVTTPFKEEVMNYLDEIDQTASCIGAVNTIKIIGNKKIGYNTDYLGFEKSLINTIEKEKVESALILGSGGATKAIKYALNKNEILIFGIPETVTQLERLYDNSRSLSELGFKVSVGTVVWNQHKDILTNDATKTRLIYSSDIKDGELTMKQYKNVDKKNFIAKEGITRPVLVLNRGYGVGTYNFQYCLINKETNSPYLIENHLITISPYTQSELTDDELIYLYNKIIRSLDDDKTKEFMDLYFGNNAINTTEINYILPIYS